MPCKYVLPKKYSANEFLSLAAFSNHAIPVKTYLQGIYVEQDIDKAITYLYLASEGNYHFAEYALVIVINTSSQIYQTEQGYVD